MGRIFLACLLVCCPVTAVFGQETTLQLVSPDVLWPQDSIPEHAGERVVGAVEYTRTNGETGYVPASWVMVLINRPYEQTRLQLHDVVHQAFGIDSERERHRTVDGEAAAVPRLSFRPLFEDLVADFRVIGVPVTEIREHHIKTKRYNTQVRWWKSYSESEWRVIDGAPLFQKACSLLVVSRMDSSREWVWMHPGIPMPFTGINDTRLVTDKEAAAIATLLKNTGAPPAHFFVQVTDYESDRWLAVMRAIREVAINLPAP